ncbi:hypothetical protein VTK56DRAFT_650 [Thermocarpiscus australiensis]
MASTQITNIRRSAEAARIFVDWYYRQINIARPIAPAYINGHPAYANHPPADICINGLVVATPEEWESLLEKQRQAPSTTPAHLRAVRYEVQSYDVHVINNDYRFGAPQKLLDAHGPHDGVRMMMLLTVSGTVYFGVDKSDRHVDNYAYKQHFNDVFILVPDWDLLARPGPKHERRKYLIASHTYRAY